MSKHKKSADAGGDATWAAQPASGDWDTAANWSTNSVPTGTATFSATQNAAITFAPGSNATVQEIAFDDQAPAYTFTFADADPTAPALTIAGTGCSNAGTTTQQFKVASASQNYKQAQLEFTNSASAGGPNISYVSGPASPTAIGGGVIGFYDTATAGSAVFTIRTGSGAPPKTNSTVGGEISFSNNSNAGTATFTTYGSTGTANKGDTFGNTVFHDSSSAANATFTNAGATVAPGDGGNTQFYDSSTAASAHFYNYGATVSGGYGGDVAFDGTANAGTATFHNYPSTAAGGSGGVVSFNNNWPPVAVNQGASAGNALIYNLGAKAAGQGGGHTSFSGIYGSPSGDQAAIFNYGSAVASNSASAAGHTTFSVQTPQTAAFTPSAGNASIWNGAGLASGAPGGLTSFTNYGAGSSKPVGPNGPSAGSAIIVNVGAGTPGAKGGATEFSYWANAANATLVAMGGFNGGAGGSISFRDNASGGSASVWIQGNGTLDISYLNASTLTIKNLVTLGGTIITSVGSSTVSLTLSNQLKIEGGILNFNFYGKGVTAGQGYTILTAPNMAAFSASQFSGNAVGGQSPQFSISGNNLQVTFGSGSGSAKKRVAAVKVKAAPNRKAKPAPTPKAKKRTIRKKRPK